MGIFKRKEKQLQVPEECRDFPIEVDRNTCNREMLVGFRDPATGKLKYAELAYSPEDIEAFKKKYGRDI